MLLTTMGKWPGSWISSGNSRHHAFFWDPQAQIMRDLGDLGSGNYSEPKDININGQVVGQTMDAEYYIHGFLWDPQTGIMQDLGRDTSAYAINSKGQVAGQGVSPEGYAHAILWDTQTQTMQDLGTLGGKPLAGPLALTTRAK